MAKVENRNSDPFHRKERRAFVIITIALSLYLSEKVLTYLRKKKDKMVVGFFYSRLTASIAAIIIYLLGKRTSTSN